MLDKPLEAFLIAVTIKRPMILGSVARQSIILATVAMQRRFSDQTMILTGKI
jgi:hypothetical protein